MSTSEAEHRRVRLDIDVYETDPAAAVEAFIERINTDGLRHWAFQVIAVDTGDLTLVQGGQVMTTEDLLKEAERDG